jgi:pimeloyl-ACP methyl ester carboxylesterase
MIASDEAQVRTAADARAERYRRAEQACWQAYGLVPTEGFVEVGSPPARLRVQELGSGEPVLFVNGTGGPGAYFAPLLAALPGFRCLVLDRPPGWGLSSPVDFSEVDYGTVVSELLRQTLDAAGIERVHAVGGWIGNLWVLRLAQAQPARVERLVLLRSPLGRIITRVPENRRMLGRQLAGLGHGPGRDAGQLPAAFIDWHLAMSRETDWARHEREMVRRIVGRRGYVPGLVLGDGELVGIGQPTLMVYGTADPIGSVDTWRRFAGRLPRAELEVVDGGGHLVWYDDPGRIGARVVRFLTG